jgi:hypothetical protein
MRELAGSFALLAASLTLSVLAAEGFARLVYPVGVAHYQLDDRVLYKLVPGSRWRYFLDPTDLGPGDHASVLVKVDAHGFRGDGLSESKRGRRVVVYGDSFVEAEFTATPATFVAQLGDRLRETRGEAALEVINAGVAGYGPDQVALRIEDEVGPLAPDLVVVCVFAGNDFGDLVRNKLFRLDENGALIRNHPVIPATVQRQFADAARAGRQPGLWRLLRAAIAPAEPNADPRDVDGELAMHQSHYKAFVEDKSDVVEDFFYDPYDADVALQPEAPSTRFKTALLEQVLARIDRTLRAHHTPWLLVVIPSATDVARDPFTRVDRSTHPGYDPRRLGAVVIEAARRQGIAYCDLYETLHESPEERLYFRESHWNAAGQRKAAARVGTAIDEGGLLR